MCCAYQNGAPSVHTCMSRATTAQYRALSRLPLGAREILKDTRRRALWARLIKLGWAEWDVCREVLSRTSAGYVMSARSQQEYEDRISSEVEWYETERAETERAERAERGET
jgi:hypothetical protein